MKTLPTRRSIIAAAAVSPFVRTINVQSPPETTSNGLIVRMNEPRNLETPMDGLKTWQTKTNHFYVRSHFAVPNVSTDDYRLTVCGHVERPLSLSLKEIGETDSKRSQPLTLECAGNGRVFLAPPVPGLQWGVGGVGNADWAGVALGAILERAKPKTGAVDVVLVGADKGLIAGPPSSPGPIHFDRGIPMDKAKRDECLLATHMNDEPLTPSHGAPLRAVIGGWYGMASVKWLSKIVVLDKSYHGFWQTLDYSVWNRTAELPSLTPLTSMQPKAIILSPGLNDNIPLRKPVTITGKAWAGMNDVATVEVSVDAGKSWQQAIISNVRKPYCWRDWSFLWTPMNTGPIGLLARCTDDKGLTQPSTRDMDRRSYQINHLIPTDITVRG